mgnify:CR=1 FL=1
MISLREPIGEIPRIETTFMAKWRKCTNNVGPVAQVEPVPSARDSTYEYPYFTYDSGIKPAGWKITSC